MRLQDKVVIITASTRGIGFAAVKACAAEGAIVYMAARNLERAQKSADELNQQGHRVHVVYNDADKPESHATMIEQVIKEQGRVDVLVNNFGYTDVSVDFDVLNTDFKDIMTIIEKNLASVYLTSQAVVKTMAENGGGSIINISSIGGQLADIARTGYCLAKKSVNYLTECMALQFGRQNIRVNAVCPGQTATDAVMNNMSEDFQNFFNRHTPLNRMGQPEEMAQTIVYLASDGAAYTTGQIIAVSGGFGLGTPLYADMISLKEKQRG